MVQISPAGETDKHGEEISCVLRWNRREARRWVKEIEWRAKAIFVDNFEQALWERGFVKAEGRNEHKNQCEVTLGKTGLCVWLRLGPGTPQGNNNT